MATTYNQSSTASTPFARPTGRGVYIGLAAAIVIVLGVLYALNRPVVVDPTIPATAPSLQQVIPDGSVPPASATMERGTYPESTIDGSARSPSTGTSSSDTAL